jgi:CBS domain containing-hemolysin-like protein
MITVLYLALVFFLVFANGFFVASEFARRSRIEMLAQSGTFRVEKVDGRRILRVRFQPREKESYPIQALIPLFSAAGSSLM